MKQILLLGDIHADRTSLEEIQEILNEVFFSQREKFEEVWFLGDVINQNEKKPHPLVLDWLTKIMLDISKTAKIIICIGNHETLSDDVSTLDYLYHLGVQIVRHHGTVVLQNRTIYLGHHFWNESDIHYRDMRFKVSELSKKYDLCLSGHDHQYKEYKKNVINLGSLRRVSFAEASYGIPKYGILSLKSTQSITFKAYDVQSAIPMQDICSIKDALKINPRAKIRLVFKNFDDFIANVNNVNKLEKRFVEFAVKHDYKTITKKENKKIKKSRSFEESFSKYLKTIKNEEVRNFIKNCWNKKEE